MGKFVDGKPGAAAREVAEKVIEAFASAVTQSVFGLTHEAKVTQLARNITKRRDTQTRKKENDFIDTYLEKSSAVLAGDFIAKFPTDKKGKPKLSKEVQARIEKRRAQKSANRSCKQAAQVEREKVTPVARTDAQARRGATEQRMAEQKAVAREFGESVAMLQEDPHRVNVMWFMAGELPQPNFMDSIPTLATVDERAAEVMRCLMTSMVTGRLLMQADASLCLIPSIGQLARMLAAVQTLFPMNPVSPMVLQALGRIPPPGSKDMEQSPDITSFNPRAGLKAASRARDPSKVSRPLKSYADAIAAAAGKLSRSVAFKQRVLVEHREAKRAEGVNAEIEMTELGSIDALEAQIEQALSAMDPTLRKWKVTVARAQPDRFAIVSSNSPATALAAGEPSAHILIADGSDNRGASISAVVGPEVGGSTRWLAWFHSAMLGGLLSRKKPPAPSQ